MPIPAPSSKEEQQNFISRCMGDAVMVKEYTDQKQRAAICYSQYKRAKTHNTAKGSMEEPLWEEQSLENVLIII